MTLDPEYFGNITDPKSGCYLVSGRCRKCGLLTIEPILLLVPQPEGTITLCQGCVVPKPARDPLIFGASA